MSFQFLRTRVEIVPANPPWPEADVLILPTNDYLWMATGPALETKILAGEEAELAAVRLGPIPVGGAVIAPPGSLPLTAIVHAAVMGQDLRVGEADAARAIGRAIEMVAGRGWARVLIHSLLSTGRGTRPEAANGALSRVVEILLDETPLRSVILLSQDETERSILHEAMMRIVQGHS